MSLRLVALAAALLGGACWVARMFVDLQVLRWAGLVLLAVAVGAAGAGLVSRRAGWLRVVAAACSVALAASVVELVRARADERLLEGLVGGTATLLVAVALLRPSDPATAGHRRGSHR